MTVEICVLILLDLYCRDRTLHGHLTLFARAFKSIRRFLALFTRFLPCFSGIYKVYTRYLHGIWRYLHAVFASAGLPLQARFFCADMTYTFKKLFILFLFHNTYKVKNDVALRNVPFEDSKVPFERIVRADAYIINIVDV